MEHNGEKQLTAASNSIAAYKTISANNH